MDLVSVSDINIEELIAPFQDLREDQLTAMRCLGELVGEIKASTEPMAFGVFWVGEKDLLGDAQVTWVGNHGREGVEKIIRHAYQRICKPQEQDQ